MKEMYNRKKKFKQQTNSRPNNKQKKDQDEIETELKSIKKNKVANLVFNKNIVNKLLILSLDQGL